MKSGYTFSATNQRTKCLCGAIFADLINAQGQPFRIVECDLYKIFLRICEEKADPERHSQYGEEKKARECLLKQLQKAVSPEAFVEKNEIRAA